MQNGNMRGTNKLPDDHSLTMNAAGGDSVRNPTHYRGGLLDKRLKVSDLIGIILAILTSLGSVYMWFQWMVSSEVERQVSSYKYLLSGIALISDEEYNDAADQLSMAYKKTDKKELSVENLKAILDPLLYAIVNSEDIEKAGPYFRRIVKPNLDGLPLYGWHHQQLGWYYLLTSRQKKARQEFDESIIKYRDNENDRGASQAYWGIAVLNMTEGNLDGAIASSLKAAELNPREYAIEKFALDGVSMRRDPWFKSLESKYSEMFAPTFEDWREEIYVRRIEIFKDLLVQTGVLDEPILWCTAESI